MVSSERETGDLVGLDGGEAKVVVLYQRPRGCGGEKGDRGGSR